MAIEERSVFDGLQMKETKDWKYKLSVGAYLLVYCYILILLLTIIAEDANSKAGFSHNDTKVLMGLVLGIAGLSVRKSVGWIFSAIMIETVVVLMVSFCLYNSGIHINGISLLLITTFLAVTWLLHTKAVRSFYKCSPKPGLTEVLMVLAGVVLLSGFILKPYLQKFYPA